MKVLGIFLAVFALSWAADARGESRITGGSVADRGLLPYHVHIVISVPNFLRICGGAYIRYNYALTAAHCVFDSTDLRLYFGKVDSISGPFSKFEHILGRDFVFIHPQFNNPTNYANDLALIFLPNGEPSDMLDPYMTPVKLPFPTDGPFDNRLGVASGFGRYSDSGDAVFSTNLRYVSKRVIAAADCAAAHPLIFDFDKFCTETFFGSTCSGDEGAPYVIDMGDGRQILAGIGSFGLAQCTVGTPPIFTNLVNHLEWIEEITGGEPPAVPPPDGCQCDCHCNFCQTCPEPLEPISAFRRAFL